MLEPQEIDALLISALYGELTPAEETRLEAHLGSHPADKSALAALTSTREAVRSSRILQVQLDPPQSVSALLMQEAARRAPKVEGWFARLARSFMAHPAMAAAAMLVVVIGVATLVQNRKGDHFADATAPSQSMEAKPSVTDQTIAPAQDHIESRGGLDRWSGAAGSSAAPGSGSSAALGGDTNDAYKVSLDDSDERLRKLETEKADGKKAEGAKQQAAATPRDVSGVADEKTKNSKAGVAKPPSGAYMELRSPEPTVKDFEPSANGETQGRAYATQPDDDLAKKESVNAVTPGPGLGAGGGNGTATTTATAPTAAPRGNAAPATKAPVKADPQKAPDSQVARNVDSSRNQQAPARNSPQPAPPPPPAKVAANTGTAKGAAPTEDKSANDPALAWAREQHTAIIARVRNGDCKGAASIAVVLANRDLGYYKQNVASDRSVKECLAYIDNAREKDQEQRAERSKATQKRTTNEPAAAKKAADQPASTESTH